MVHLWMSLFHYDQKDEERQLKMEESSSMSLPWFQKSKNGIRWSIDLMKRQMFFVMSPQNCSGVDRIWSIRLVLSVQVQSIGVLFRRNTPCFIQPLRLKSPIGCSNPLWLQRRLSQATKVFQVHWSQMHIHWQLVALILGKTISARIRILSYYNDLDLAWFHWKDIHCIFG